MYAVGCKVLSEEYSNPSLIILISLALPIVVDFEIMYASWPSLEFDPIKIGDFLYSDPPETILILLIPPFADVELVKYFKTSHWSWEYFKFSGNMSKEILKVVDPIPEIL